LKDASGKVVGNRTRLKLVKNKIAPPFTECEFDIMYNEGISQASSVIDLGIEHGIFEKKGAWVSYQGNLIGQGREAAKEYLRTHPDFMDQIVREIIQKVRASGGVGLAKDAFETKEIPASETEEGTASEDTSGNLTEKVNESA
jgi:recombination protein RecA